MEPPVLILFWFCLISSLICPMWSKTNLKNLEKTQENHDRIEKTHHSEEVLVPVSSILTSIIRNTNYDKNMRPNYGGPPTEVGINMYILLPSLSETNMELTVTVYFREFWKDHRLAFENGIKEQRIGSDILENIWTPDTFFSNAIESNFHTVISKNEFVRIDGDGNIRKSTKLTVKTPCIMDFSYFPMDTQTCPINIESYGHTMKDIRYKWKDGYKSVGIAEGDASPQFIVMNITVQNVDVSLPQANYSRLECQMKFRRNIDYYLFNGYLPAAIIVILSWASFWLDQKAATARVMLSSLCIFGLIYLMLSVNASLPKVTYLKCMDIYMGMCLMMVFASLLEYLTINYTAKRLRVYKKRLLHCAQLMEYWKPIDHFLQKTTNQNLNSGQMKNETRDWPHLEGTTTPIPQMNLIGEHDNETCSSDDVDKYSRIVFPVLFVCLNWAYIYTHSD